MPAVKPKKTVSSLKEIPINPVSLFLNEFIYFIPDIERKSIK